MARPFKTRPSVRVQTEGRPQTPGLGVYAPLGVRTPGSNLQGLMQALGSFGPAVAQAKGERDNYWAQQGAADETLGEADMELAKKHRTYADAAFKVATIEQTNEAFQKVSQRADEELDHNLPVEDQTRIVDGWLKSELGSMVTDPRAKVWIAERYKPFIDTFAANALQKQVEAHAKAAEDALLTDAYTRVDNGTFSWDDIAHTLISQTGDPVRANQLLMGVIGQKIEDAAAQGQPYEHFKDLIPTESIGVDGQKIPGPLYNPKYRGLLQQSMANAEQLYNHFHETDYAQREYKARVKLDSWVDQGIPVTMDTIASAGIKVGNKPSDDISPATAAAAISAYNRAQAKRAEAQAVYENALDYRKAFGRWADVMHAPGLGLSPEKIQDAAERQLQSALTGLGVPMEQLAGQGLVSDADVVGKVAIWSATEQVPYRPLKDALQVNQAAPGDLTARTAAYEQLKGRGIAGMYVDDDTAALYESALQGQDAGLKGDALSDYIRTLGDKDTAQYVASGLADLKLRSKGQVLATGESIFSWGTDTKVSSNSLVNPAYVNGKMESLAALALSKGQSLEEAKAFAKSRFEQTHVALKFGGTYGFVARGEVGNPQTTQEALDWFEETQVPKLRADAKIPDDEPLSIVPRVSNGRQLSVEVQRAGGFPVTTWTLKGLQKTYLDTHPQESPQAKAARVQERAKQRRKQQASGTVPGDLTNYAHALENKKYTGAPAFPASGND